MADTKISALTAATTPLAGTEVLPIVQGGVTVKVTVANLTAGRSITVNDVTASGELVSTTNNARISLYRSAGTNYFDWASGQTLAFGTQTSQGGAGRVNKINFYDNGDLGNATGNYVPGTAAKGVNFTANTAAAGMTSQLLNWYEEGTWTPTSYDITYSSATGVYTRIGRQVFVHFSITLPTTTDANNITIVGFPFTVANSDAMRSGSIGYTDYATACTASPVKNATRGNIFTFGGTAVTNVAASGKTFAGVFIYSV